MEFGGTTDWGTDTEGFQGFNAVFCLLNHPFVQGVNGQGFSFSDLETSFAHGWSFCTGS